MTADGAEIYVGGPALSVCTLGEILRAAGAVRAMELDINPDWVSGVYFHDTPGAAPQGFRLYPAQKVPPAERSVRPLGQRASATAARTIRR